MTLYKLLLLALTIASQYVYCADISAPRFVYKLHPHEKFFNVMVYRETVSKKHVPIGGITCDFNESKTESEITSLDVYAQYRYKGIGTQLMLLALQHIKANNIKEVRWLSTIDAMPFYKRIGAKPSTDPNDDTNFEFIFDRDGDPEENLEKYYATKTKRHKKRL